MTIRTEPSFRREPPRDAATDRATTEPPLAAPAYLAAPAIPNPGPSQAQEAAPGLGGNEHPLLDIPFSVFVDGRQYSGAGISLLEAQVVGLADPALENQERLVRIAFDFHGFSVSIHPMVRIARDRQGLVLRFAEPTGEHLPQLRHILNDYISGDLTSLGTVIRASSLTGPKAPGRASGGRSTATMLRAGLRTAVVVALTLLLVLLAATLIQRRLLISDLAAPAHIAADGEVLRAVADGQISYMDVDAAPGEVAFAIATTSGETLSIAMPCECEVTLAGVAQGSTVLSGEPVLRLSEGAPAMIIEASVPVDALFALQQAGGAEIRLADGSRVFARLTDQDIQAAPDPRDAFVAVRLEPVEPLAPELIGQAVALRLTRPTSTLFAPFLENFRAVRSAADAS